MSVALVAMAMVALVAGDAASADRTVLVEYFNSVT
jgi:hypothetical protein